MEKIFDPFTQAETGTTRKYGGTGLGLAITKNIIEIMGGTLSVESVPGSGSKFGFDLTFDTIEAADGIYQQNNVFNESKRPTFSAEILLCEDNIMNQQVICEHLARVGIKTVVAENGKIGVDLVRQRLENGEKLFDLVFMDMHMPVMDGLEASAKIMELNAGIPIVAMTANIMSGDREIYKMSGMNDCVGKPFTSHELWHCLMKYLTPASFENIHKSECALEDDGFQKELEALFARKNRDKYNEIVKALEDNDIKLAHRLAHTLKGNAGQIGKTILQQAAANVEHGLKDGKNMITPGLLTLLETELQTVLDELSPLVEKMSHNREESAQSGRKLETDTALELLDKLKPMLEMGNPECRAFCADLRMIGTNDELVRRLIQQMDDFDFEPAIVTLGEIKKSMA
jgi:CheY-like chemotaxis protein